MKHEMFIKDVNYLIETIIKKHKNIWHFINEVELNKITYEVKENILEHKFCSDNFPLLLLKIFNKIGDLHTGIVRNNEMSEFSFEYIEDEIYAFMVPKENKNLLLTKLTSVNGIPIDKFVRLIETYITYDNLQAKAWKTVQSLNDINLIGFITNNTSKTITYGFSNNITVESQIRSVNRERLSISKNKSFSFMAWNPKYYIEEKNKTLYIRYKECVEDENYSHKDFANDIYNKIRKKKYEKIIIDLRSNFGGSSQLFEHSIMEIKRYLIAVPSTKTYCLINKEVISSGVIHAFDAKYILGAKLIGQPTSQGYNMYGELRYFKLPNSQHSIFYSTDYFELLPGYTSKIVEPDIYIEPTLKDYENGIDPVVEYCIKDK